MFSYLPITVSIEDVNDNIPEFVNAPYGPIIIDELAPPGIRDVNISECNIICDFENAIPIGIIIFASITCVKL